MPTPATAFVLSGGGARAAYQVGALAALAELAPALEVPIITGVSAGAINAVKLAATPGPLTDRVAALRRDWEALTSDQVYRVRAGSLAGAFTRLAFRGLLHRRPGVPTLRGLLDPDPLRVFLGRHAQLSAIEENVRSGALRAVGLSATSYSDGSTVTFVQGAPEVPMWSRARRYAVRTALTVDHVLASSAIPIVFPAVPLDIGHFGDGSVRQTAPLAPAIHLGADRIVAVSIRGPAHARATAPGEYPSSAEVFGLLMHSVFLDALDADAERMERTNVLLRQLLRAQREASGLRPIGFLLLQPSRDVGAMARSHPWHLPALLTRIVQGMGGRQVRAADFVSYLLFEPAFTGELMDLGYHDTLARREAIEAFLSTDP